MMTRMRTTAIAVVAIAGLTACEQTGVQPNAGVGAGAGAVAGAIAGQLIGGDREATAIGAVVGAGVGAVIGNQLKKQQEALQRDIGGSGAQIINTGDRLVVSLPEAITFPVDSATVRASIQDDIAAIARNLQQFPNNTVQVIGHTDNTGGTSYNQGLSERRANAVTSILLANGVPGSRIVTFGRGETQPVQSNATPEGRQANRRVEIIITPNA